MTIGNIIDTIQQKYSKGVNSDDTRLDDPFIYRRILSTRNQLIFRKAQKNQIISQWNYSNLNCLNVEEAPATECDCVPDIIKQSCKVYKVNCPFPEVLIYKQNYLIESISNALYTREYSFISVQDLKNLSGRKYTSKLPRSYINNGYLYIIDTKNPKVIQANVVLANPLEIRDLQSCVCSQLIDPCLPNHDIRFPIDKELEEPLIEMVLQNLIELFHKLPEDITNNNRDTQYEKTK